MDALLDVLQTLWLVVLLYIGRFTFPLGGLLWMLIGLLTEVRLIGPILDRLVNAPIYLGAVIKPITWVVASSGIFLGMIVFELLGNQIRLPIQFLILALFAAQGTLKIINDLITFNNEASYIDEIFPSIEPFIRRMRGQEATRYLVTDDKLLTRLARSLFVDQTLPMFFRLIISIGILYYALGHLGVLQLVGATPPGLGESIVLAFSVLDLTGAIEVPFTGTAWEVLRVANALLAFFWLVLFVSLASSTIDNSVERVRSHYNADKR